MNPITILFIFVPVLVVILLMANVLLAAHRPDTEKVTAYECGFSPIYGQTRAPFSIQYYLVGILFLIFDLEILLIYPLAVTLYQVSVYGFVIAMLFFAVLTLGFVYELGKGRLYFTDQRSSIASPRVTSNKSIPSSYRHQRISVMPGKGLSGIRAYSTKAEKKTSSLTEKFYEPDHGQDSKNIYHLAKRHIKSGTRTDVTVINRFLAPFELFVSLKEFEGLVSIKPVNMVLPLSKSNSIILGRSLGNSHSDIATNRRAGVYIFTNLVTGELYVGSSIYLSPRIRHYFKPGIINKGRRLVNRSMKNTGVNNFSLAVYFVQPNKDNMLALVRALEQYYIFTLNPALNTIKVAGGTSAVEMTDELRALIGRHNSKPLYVYNADKSLLLYYADSAAQFVREMDVSAATITKYLNTGLPLYGKLVLSRELVSGVIPAITEVSDMSSFMSNARTLQKSTHMGSAETRVKIMASNKQKVDVTITDLALPNKPLFRFDSIQQAYNFSRAYAPNRSRVVSREYLLNNKNLGTFVRNSWLVAYI